MKKPILAITIGDPAGIGPEIILKSLALREIYHHCRPLVIGDAQVFSLRNYRIPFKIRPVLNPAQARYRFGTMDVLHAPCFQFQQVQIGFPNAISGEMSAQAVKQSVELALTNLADGVVHAPISKLAWKVAGVRFPGHTEMIAQLCNTKKVAMAIVCEPLKTVLVTRHIPLNQVSKQLKKTEIVQAARLSFDWLTRLGIRRPKIGVCALNPHAGERGLLGLEELKVIGPAVHQLKKEFGDQVSGPLPADSAFSEHKKGLYDCLVTMYHDQSLIPLKLFNSEKLVNITLGLPFPRTSPGHGTACEIAGKNCANPKSMIEAILTAARLAAK